MKIRSVCAAMVVLFATAVMLPSIAGAQPGDFGGPLTGVDTTSPLQVADASAAQLLFVIDSLAELDAFSPNAAASKQILDDVGRRLPNLGMRIQDHRIQLEVFQQDWPEMLDALDDVGVPLSDSLLLVEDASDSVQWDLVLDGESSVVDGAVFVRALADLVVRGGEENPDGGGPWAPLDKAELDAVHDYVDFFAGLAGAGPLGLDGLAPDSGFVPGADAMVDGAEQFDAVSSDAASSDAASSGAASSTEISTLDSGSVDSGSVDSGSVDSGSVDSGSVDSGSVDSGSVDSASAEVITIGEQPEAAGEGSGLLLLIAGASVGVLAGVGLIVGVRRRSTASKKSASSSNWSGSNSSGSNTSGSNSAPTGLDDDEYPSWQSADARTTHSPPTAPSATAPSATAPSNPVAPGTPASVGTLGQEKPVKDRIGAVLEGRATEVAHAQQPLTPEAVEQHPILNPHSVHSDSAGASEAQVPGVAVGSGPGVGVPMSLIDASRRMTAAKTSTDIAEIALLEAKRLVHASAGLFVLLGDAGPVVAAADATISFTLAKVAASGVERVFETGQATTQVDASIGFGDTAMATAVVPVVAKGSIAGVLLVAREAHCPFVRSDVETLEVLAPLAGSALGASADREQAERLIDVEPMTGLKNRRRLDRDLAEIDRESMLSYFMIDVDNFKHFNDTNGHAAGDEALRTVADLLSENVRPEDVVYRYGGEEFCVLLPGASSRQALVIAERVRAAVEVAHIEGQESQPGGSVTVSIGIADTASGRPLDLVERADAALYEAKDAGRNQIRLESSDSTDTPSLDD